MFRQFFLNRKWWWWSLGGSLLILFGTWYQIQIDVKINEWFRVFYDALEQIVKKPNSVPLSELMAKIFDFIWLAGLYVLVWVLVDFFGRHYIFRWRIALTEYYQEHWQEVRHIEGASQRIQEDTMRFAKTMEYLGVNFLRSVLTLIAFLPTLHELSSHITELPWIGKVNNSLVFVALIFSIIGTVGLALIGVKLPGLEFQNQRVEAAYRKELVLGEDSHEYASPLTLKELFDDVRKNYYRLYWHYLYFDIARWSYSQFAVMVPYLAVAPSLVAGAISLGLMNQIVNAFNRVQNAFQFLVNSWSTIVELMSIYKRLYGLDKHISTSQTQQTQQS